MQQRLIRYVISFVTKSFSHFTKCSFLFPQSTVSCSAKYCFSHFSKYSFACLGKACLAIKLSKFPKVSATLACHEMKNIWTEITIFHMQLLSKPITRLNFVREIIFFRPKINLKKPPRSVSGPPDLPRKTKHHFTCLQVQYPVICYSNASSKLRGRRLSGASRWIAGFDDKLCYPL